MALFYLDSAAPPAPPPGQPSVELLHRLECKACPLARVSCFNGNMPASGAVHPLIYVLGEAPGAEEDKAGRQFVGESGRFLRDRIPLDFDDVIRWNNVVRTRPPKNRTPTWVEIESCRPSVVRDIEVAAPKALLLVGGTATRWALDLDGNAGKISAWRGRWVPVRIGQHVAWAFPVTHPSAILRTGKESDIEAALFDRDMARFFAEVEGLSEPVVADLSRAFSGIETVVGNETGALTTVKQGLARLSQSKWVAIDIETATAEKAKPRQLRPYARNARILSFAISDGEYTLAVALHHSANGWIQTDLEKVHDLLFEFLVNPAVAKVAHNCVFELEWLTYFYGDDVLRASTWHDTMAQAFTLDERRDVLGLDVLCVLNFALPLKELSAVDRARLDEYAISKVLRYNGGDALWTARLFKRQRAALKAVGLISVYNSLRARFPTVVAAQLRGVVVDLSVNKRLSEEYSAKIDTVLDELAAMPVVREFERRGTLFTPSKNEQVLCIVRDIIKSPALQVPGKPGQPVKYSTDEEYLSKVDHPFAQKVLVYRELAKALSTYVHSIGVGGKSLWPDKLLHTSFNVLLTRTGRLSSDNPNLQNVPKRTDEGKRLRSQIVPRPGHVFLSVDYGQIEARVLAMASEDPVFVRSLWENIDVHMEWAVKIAQAYPARIGGKDKLHDKDAMKAFRGDVKNQWVFPAFYGAQLRSVAGYLDIPERVLAPLFDEFWDVFKGVKRWQKRLVKFYDEHGYVECLNGQRRHGPLYGNKIINTPIQGTAAAIVCDRMNALSLRAWEENDPCLQPLVNIHDDLMYEVPEKHVDEYLSIIIDEMLDVDYPWINCPISLEAAIGPRWSEMKEIGKYDNARDTSHRRPDYAV